MRMNSSNKWIVTNPIEWSRFDTFYWFFDWSQRKKVQFSDIEKFCYELPYGRILMEKDINYFITYFGKYGLDIFEDFHILLTSFDEFFSSNQNNKLKILKIPTNDSILKQRLLCRNNIKYPKILLFIKNILLNPSSYPDLIKWCDNEKKSFLMLQPNKIAKIWGMLSDNPHMTFATFSRSLRYSYKLNYLVHMNEKFTYEIIDPAFLWN